MRNLILVIVAGVAVGCSRETPVAPAQPASASATEARIDPALGNGGRSFVVALTGGAEVTPGDPDGSGTARLTFNPGQEEVCFELTVSGIAPATAAHIHEAPAGSAGPVVVGLTPPTNGTSRGCVTLDREEIKEIMHDPSLYYVNVHNDPYPGGALRGQLSK